MMGLHEAAAYPACEAAGVGEVRERKHKGARDTTKKQKKKEKEVRERDGGGEEEGDPCRA